MLQFDQNMPILVLDLGSSSFFCYFALVERLAIQAIQAMQVWRARLAHQWVSFSIWSSHLPWKHILPVKHPHFHLKKWKIKIEEEKIKNLKLKILPHVHLKRKDRNWKKKWNWKSYLIITCQFSAWMEPLRNGDLAALLMSTSLLLSSSQPTG